MPGCYWLGLIQITQAIDLCLFGIEHSVGKRLNRPVTYSFRS